MAIDIKKLRKGEKVPCDTCKIGVMIPAYGAPPEKAPQFICDNCGEKLTINYGKKRTNRP